MVDEVSDDLDRLRELAERVDKLEARLGHFDASQQRALLRAYELERRLWRTKFAPKLFEFTHYPRRELKVPEWYRQQILPQNPPSIAIVTPSYNQAEYIAATINSVQAQNYPKLHYVVQDGGSTDSTCSVLATYGDKLQWQSKPDGGQAAAINDGFRLISGEIMAYLNSDDILLPGTLAYVAHVFRTHPEIDLLYGHRIVIDHTGSEVGRWVLPRHDAEALKWVDYIPQETLFWRKRVWDSVGPLDESFTFAMDWDFILRSQAAGFRFKRMPRFLAGFRAHPQQKTITQANIGNQEQDRLREIHLGWTPKPRQIEAKSRRYLRRHVLYHRLYKAGILRY